MSEENKPMDSSVGDGHKPSAGGGPTSTQPLSTGSSNTTTASTNPSQPPTGSSKGPQPQVKI